MATWPTFALLLLGFLLCSQLFTWRQEKLAEYARAEARAEALPGRISDEEQEELAARSWTFDSRFWYSGAEAEALLKGLGEKGRRLYWTTQVSLDLVFPVIYTAMFAVFVVRLYANEKARFLLLAPVVAALFDYGENFSTAWLAATWSEGSALGFLTYLAASCTAMKRMLIFASLVIVLVGAITGRKREVSEQAPRRR
jgi:hypothetical protein